MSKNTPHIEPQYVIFYCGGVFFLMGLIVSFANVVICPVK